MKLHTLLCLLLVLPNGLFCYTNAQDGTPGRVVPGQDFNDRLTKVEALLEASLRKNAELESRIEVLEDENKQLKASVRVLETKRDDRRQQGSDPVEENTGSLPEIADLQHVKARRPAVPRMVLAITNSATVAFTAVVSPVNETNLGTHQTIVYDHVITNVGGAYHNTTGIFLAPVSGVYVFNWNTMVEPGDREYLTLVKNGQRIQMSYAHGTGESRYESSSMTVTLEVKQGEEVWVRRWGGSATVHGNGFTTFSGWLLTYTD